MEGNWSDFWQPDISVRATASQNGLSASPSTSASSPVTSVAVQKAVSPGGVAPSINKRKRIVHPNHNDLGACDTCRSRRVKCVRKDPNDRTCAECRSRKIPCTNLRNDGHRYPAKMWAKKPSKARSAADAPMEPPPLISPQTPSEGYPATTVLSDSLAAGRLRVIEENTALLASLLHTYLDGASFRFPILRWSALRDRFENAGHTLSRLDPMTEILVLSCVGFGILTTDSPLILGAGAPRLDDLTSVKQDLDLSLWSCRRKPFAEQLRDHVVDLAERRGLFRVPCFESVAALFLMSDFCASTGQTREALTLRSASIAHLRRLFDEDNLQSEMQLPIEWTFALDDSFRSLEEGVSFLLGDDVIEELLCLEDQHSPSLDDIPAIINASDLEVYGTGLCRFWTPLILLNRRIAKSVSVPLRRRKPIQLSTWQDLVPPTVELFRLAGEARKAAVELQVAASPDVAVAQASKFGATAGQNFSALAYSHVATNALLLQKFLDWKAQTQVFEGDEGCRVRGIEEALNEVFVEGILVVVQLLKRPGAMNVQALTTYLNILGNTAQILDVCLELALSVPHQEVGGNPKYPLATKIEVADILIQALQLQSWTFASKFDAAKEGRSRLEPLRSAAAPSTPVVWTSEGLGNAVANGVLFSEANFFDILPPLPAPSTVPDAVSLSTGFETFADLDLLSQPSASLSTTFPSPTWSQPPLNMPPFTFPAFSAEDWMQVVQGFGERG